MSQRVDTLGVWPSTFANWQPRAAYVKQYVRDRLIDHKHYTRQHGEDMPEIREWKWPY